MQSIIREGKAIIKVQTAKVVSKELPVFYNPVMKFNRDITIQLLGALNKKWMKIADPLAASGIRSIRFLKELPKSMIKNILINDGSRKACISIQKNLKLNKINSKVKVFNQEANRFLLENKPFDYIDIDPFGSPTPFLSSSMQSISRDGILAITATDTGALAGAFPEAGKRKYFAQPLKNEFMHETALRILARRVQLEAAQFDLAAIPILSYFKDHYYRQFFIIQGGAKVADKVLQNHKYLLYCKKCLNRFTSHSNSAECHGTMQFAGPLYIGPLGDKDIISKMEKSKFMDCLLKESKDNIVGFYDIHKMAKMYKKVIPKNEILLNRIKDSYVSHALPTGIKTNKSIKEIIRLF